MFLLDREGAQVIRHAINDCNNILHSEVEDAENNIVLIKIRVPIWNRELKECMFEDAFNSSGHKLTYLEPIVLRFNSNDCLNIFWFFSNRCTKRYEYEGKV